MPYKFDTDKKNVGKKYDKRRKLTDEQKEEIKRLYGKISQRNLAKMFGVSRRLIIFIGCPEKYTENLKARINRGGSKIYYYKKHHTESMRLHRHHKQQLSKDDLLEDFNDNKIRKCPICKTSFRCERSNRIYCFKCSPTGRSDKDA